MNDEDDAFDVPVYRQQVADYAAQIRDVMDRLSRDTAKMVQPKKPDLHPTAYASAMHALASAHLWLDSAIGHAMSAPVQE